LYSFYFIEKGGCFRDSYTAFFLFKDSNFFQKSIFFVGEKLLLSSVKLNLLPIADQHYKTA